MSITSNPSLETVLESVEAINEMDRENGSPADIAKPSDVFVKAAVAARAKDRENRDPKPAPRGKDPKTYVTNTAFRDCVELRKLQSELHRSNKRKK